MAETYTPEHQAWLDLRRQMAIQTFTIEAAEMMIPSDEAKERAERIAKAADANPGSPDPILTRWQDRLHYMGNALIALKDLGYKVTPPG